MSEWNTVYLEKAFFWKLFICLGRGTIGFSVYPLFINRCNSSQKNASKESRRYCITLYKAHHLSGKERTFSYTDYFNDYFTSLVSALFNATACSAFTIFLWRTSSMSSFSFGSIPSRSRSSSFSISVSFTLISNLLTRLVRSSIFLT